MKNYDYIKGYKKTNDYTLAYALLATFLLIVTMYQLSITYKLQGDYFTRTDNLVQVMDNGCTFIMDESSRTQLKNSEILTLRTINTCEEAR